MIKPVGERTRGKESNSVLTGILVCGSCGTNLLKGKKKNKTFYALTGDIYLAAIVNKYV